MSNTAAGKINSKQGATQYCSMRRLLRSFINREKINIVTGDYQTTTTPCANTVQSDLLLSQPFELLVGCQNDLWFNPAAAQHHTAFILTDPSQWDPRETQNKKPQLVGQDKVYVLRENRKREITVILVVYVYMCVFMCREL